MGVVGHAPPEGEREAMDSAVLREIEKLQRAPLERLRRKYRDVFQEEPRTRHKEQLFRRIAWRLQANWEGGLSERARQRVFEIATDADIRVLPPRGVPTSEFGGLLGRRRFDRRIPPPGAVLSREFRGSIISVKVLADAFEYQGRLFGSLSAIATKVTGTRWNGLAFFGLTVERQNGKGKYATAKQ